MECKDFLNAVSKIPQNTFDGIIASLVLKKFDFGNGYVPSESSIAVFSSNSQDDLKNSVSGAMLSSLGMNYISEDNLLTAAQNLRTQLGTSFETDFAASKIVYQPATKTYKLKMLVGDDTWSAARSWVAQEYDPGDVTVSSGERITTSFSDFSAGTTLVLFDNAVNAFPVTVADNDCTYNFYLDDGACKYTYIRGGSTSGVYTLDSSPSVISFAKSGSSRRFSTGNSSMTFFGPGTITYGQSRTDLVATAAPDIVDNHTYDYSNAGSGAREIAVGLTPAATLTANIIIDGVHGFSVSNEENTILLTKTAQDIISEDMSGTVLSISAQS